MKNQKIPKEPLDSPRPPRMFMTSNSPTHLGPGKEEGRSSLQTSKESAGQKPKQKAPDGNLQKSHSFQDLWKGQIPFQKSLELQETLKTRAKKGEPFLMGFESSHPVITHGLKGNQGDILWSGEQLKKAGMDVLPLKRGGQTTLHSPGQLVIYPVIHLPSFGWKIRDFILFLENATKELLWDLKTPTERRERNSGLFTSRGKIAFFGIHVSEGVSQHGLSINVNNDLSLFQSIKSCGAPHRPHDKLENHVPLSEPAGLFKKWTKKFQTMKELS